jgi:hypothetical protein
MSASPFLLVEEVAERERCSVRTIHERARLGLIPHLKRPGSRRLLFQEDWLRALDEGAPLEVIAQERGGRIVRPRENRR